MLEKLRVAVASVIVAAWVASLIADFLVQGYDPPATVHLLMMVVAGWLFAPAITGNMRKSNNGEGEES